MIQTHKTLSKGKIIALVVVILVVLGAAAYTVYGLNNTASTETKEASSKTTDSIDYGEATDEQKNTGLDQKGNAQSEAPASNTNEPITVVVTALNPPDSTKKTTTSEVTTLQIRVRIDLVTTAGTCYLTLTKGSTTVTKQAGTQAGPTTSTCRGFDVDQSELSLGEWKATIEVVSGDREGTVSQNFTVQ